MLGDTAVQSGGSNYIDVFKGNMTSDNHRIHLSVPHMGGLEEQFIQEAFRTNYLSTVGPNVDAFEAEVAERLGDEIHTLAVSSGTAALHLILRHIGVGPGDYVAVQSATFVGSVYPIMYLGATPVFLDSEPISGNLDPDVVVEYLRDASRTGKLPKAMIAVHLYGQHADVDPIAATCQEYGVVLVEDAAESLGATYRSRQTATTAAYGVLSFNGNKIITTTGGGMCVARDPDAIAQMRKWATQAREPVIEYEHRELGYNYRLSNVLAGIGRGQLRVLDERVAQRRQVACRYADAFADLPGVSLQPEAVWGMHTRWLSVVFIDPTIYNTSPHDIVTRLGHANIDTRPIWRPMHTQPLFAGAPIVGGKVAETMYATGLCLPSSSSLNQLDQDRVIAHLRAVLEEARLDRIR
jgi:dTDP-4-amino-4,6-dideoxygalactose transaminase